MGWVLQSVFALCWALLLLVLYGLSLISLSLSKMRGRIDRWGSDASSLLGLVQAIKGGQTHFTVWFPEAVCNMGTAFCVFCLNPSFQQPVPGLGCVKMPRYNLTISAAVTPRGLCRQALYLLGCFSQGVLIKFLSLSSFLSAQGNRGTASTAGSELGHAWHLMLPWHRYIIC